MRRRSGSNFEEIAAREFNALNKVEQSELNSIFKKTEQRNGGISFYDFINILRGTLIGEIGCGYEINEERKNRFNKDIALKEIKILDYGVLLWAASVLKKEKEDTGGHTQAEDN